MTLTVEDRPHALLQLLWLREAHGLNVRGENLPPLLAETPDAAAQQLALAVRTDWARLWPQVWQDAVEQVARDTDPRLFDRIPETPGGSPERAALLREIVGPSLRDDFGEDTFTDASYLQWEQEGMNASLSSQPKTLADSPERRALEALIPAWRAGLTRIVTIPCLGAHTRKIGAHALLTTARTRTNSESVRDALDSFA